ncbi:MAG: carboxypeptidase-like regulatory domain-containing protein [Thermoanaerobaculales bacterium]
MRENGFGSQRVGRFAGALITLAPVLLVGACASVAVHGVVKDERDMPVPAASFTLRPLTGAAEPSRTTAEDHGCFALHESVSRRQREYTLAVSAPGYKPLSLTVPTRQQVLLLVTLASASSDQDSAARPITAAERYRLYGIPCEPLVTGRSLTLH